MEGAVAVGVGSIGDGGGGWYNRETVGAQDRVGITLVPLAAAGVFGERGIGETVLLEMTDGIIET